MSVGRLVGFFIGYMTWSAPPWLAWCGRRVSACFARLRTHPRATALTLVVTAALGVGAWQSWLWWQSHKPRTFTTTPVRQVVASVSQAPRAITPGAPDKDLKPSPLCISFAGAPVAPLDKIGKDAGDAVTLDPMLPGKWTWQNGSTLRFDPQSHWPPATRLTVRLKASALAKDLTLDKDTLTATTPPLVAQLSGFSFYTSPKDPSVHQVVAELKLSHPVSLDVLQQKLRMDVVGGTPVFTTGAPGAAIFSVATDPKSERRFFIRSRPITVPIKEDWVKLTVPAGISSLLGGTALDHPAEAKTRVPDKYTGLEFTKAETKIIRTDEGEPQQFLFITTNLEIDSSEVASRIHLWWHKDGWADDKGKPVVEQRIPSATKVHLIPVEGEAPLTKQHAFRFLQARTDGGLFTRVGEGVKAPGGFETNTRFEDRLNVPEFPKETRILGKGNILALDGERKLAVQSRAVDHLRITLGRVPVSQFQHLITLTGGTFDDPAFKY